MDVTVPMTAPTTAISATDDTTNRLRSVQRRRGEGAGGEEAGGEEAGGEEGAAGDGSFRSGVDRGFPLTTRYTPGLIR
ncbi:hypothetical protein [Streptomyces inhibens]|uniref:hypothetical protein n=1 Tax=Streptomyces inhibens TaxID=2293571 RepID=UPI001FD3B08B|nr:hypothetical protein [Streptomyces inhibens]